MSKKMILLLSIIFAGLIIWGFRVYTVNAGVAKTYEIQSFKIGDSIKLDHAELKVIDFQYGEENNKNGDQSLPVKVAMEVMNTSNKDISVQRLIETKLAYGMDYYQTMEGEFEGEQLKKLSPNTSIQIPLVYYVDPKYNDKSAKLYFDQSLYKKQVIDQYHHGKRYGIAVDL